MSNAHELAKNQREISIAEFFEKNRHLLGFDNKRKSLLTVVKEAVDNSLDACEEGRILPEVTVEIRQSALNSFNYVVVVEDNGPGLIRSQIPKVFAKLLYGSKFFKLSQSRGQQGIGISAAVLYAQLTTGKPAKIISRVSPKEPAHSYELRIDVKKNSPEILKEEEIEWDRDHGTRVELALEAEYLKGRQSVDEYIKQTAIINPHVTLFYTNPKDESENYTRASEELPPLPEEIKPHPYGVEIGLLMRLIEQTSAKNLKSFLGSEFSRVGPGTAKKICENSSLLPETKPDDLTRDDAEKLIRGIEKTPINKPPIDCISPIGEDLMQKGLRKEIDAEFYCSVSKPAKVYRGNPFVVEAAMAYGGSIPKNSQVTLLRFANRVPLLYQQGACAVTEALAGVNWKPYGMQQTGKSFPMGPLVIIVHIASVWVPFTSEAKEAVAHYPELVSEFKSVLQKCGRQLGEYVNRKMRITQQLERANLFEKYIPEVADSLAALSGEAREGIAEKLNSMLSKDEIREQLELNAPEGKEENGKEEDGGEEAVGGKPE